MNKLDMEMVIVDSMATEEEVALVHEYGFGLAYPALRKFAGNADEARAFLEERRKGLQVSRWENTKGS